MRPVVHSSHRIFAAWVCLLAAMCMYAPLGVAALSVKDSCCVNGVCAVPQHHSGRTSSAAEYEAHCEHGAAGMANCSLACCHDQQISPMSPVAYLLSAPVTVNASVLTVQLFSVVRASAPFRSVEPLSPPPRS